MTLAERLAEGQPPLRIPELAAILGCSVSYLHKLIRAEAIKAGRIGNRYTIPVSEAERLAANAGALPISHTTHTTHTP